MYTRRHVGERIPIDLSKRVPNLVAHLVTHDGAVTPVRLVLDIGTSGFGAMLTSPFVERHAASLGSGPFIERALGTGIGGLAHGPRGPAGRAPVRQPARTAPYREYADRRRRLFRREVHLLAALEFREPGPSADDHPYR